MSLVFELMIMVVLTQRELIFTEVHKLKATLSSTSEWGNYLKSSFEIHIFTRQPIVEHYILVEKKEKHLIAVLFIQFSFPLYCRAVIKSTLVKSKSHLSLN